VGAYLLSLADLPLWVVSVKGLSFWSICMLPFSGDSFYLKWYRAESETFIVALCVFAILSNQCKLLFV